MKIALVHDWLVVYGGAERVLKEVFKLFPQAELFTLLNFLPAENQNFLRDKKIKTSFLQHLPMARTKYRLFLPLP